MLPADTVRESRVVFNPGRRTGLASWPEAVQYKTGQTFGRCVNCCSQARRPGSQYQNVVARVWQAPSQMEMVGQLFSCRSFKKHTTSVSDHGVRLDVFTDALEFEPVLFDRSI